MFNSHNTDWATSSKGNQWRRHNEKVLAVGKNKYGGVYWAMHDGVFLDEKFDSELEAMAAAEIEAGCRNDSSFLNKE